MGIAVDFTGLCLFLRSPQNTFNVILPIEHGSSDHHTAGDPPHQPYLAIDTRDFDIAKSRTPDLLIVTPGLPQRQLALWNLKGIDVKIGDGGEVRALRVINGKHEVGPPRVWGDMHWMVSMDELHEDDDKKFKGNPETSKSMPDLKGLGARVQLTDGALETVPPADPQHYDVRNGDTTEFDRFFVDTVRFTTKHEILWIGKFGNVSEKIVLFRGAAASVTCQAVKGSIEHFEMYYELADREDLMKRKLKSARFGLRDGFPIDCVPPGEGEGPP